MAWNNGNMQGSTFSYRMPGGGFTGDALFAQAARQGGVSYNRYNQVIDANGNPVQGGGGGMNPFMSASGNPFNPYDPQGLVAAQMSDNAWARNKNQENWEGASQKMYGTVGNYDADPLTQQARMNALNLARNPEAINDQVQGMMLAKQGNMANANAQAQYEAAQNQMINNGQADSSSQQATMNKLNNQRLAALMQGQSDLEIQRAVRRNQDITNATQLAGGLANQRAQLDFGSNKAVLDNLPQFRPDNYAGLLGALGGRGGGGGGYGGGGMYSGMRKLNLGNGNKGSKTSQYGLPGFGFNMGTAGEQINPFYGMRPTNSYFGGGTHIQNGNVRYYNPGGSGEGSAPEQYTY